MALDQIYKIQIQDSQSVFQKINEVGFDLHNYINIHYFYLVWSKSIQKLREFLVLLHVVLIRHKYLLIDYDIYAFLN